jgi:6-phosphogluconolactonase (cycloisomerase 2 family)
MGRVLWTCVSIGLLSLTGCHDVGSGGVAAPGLASIEITPASSSVAAGTSVQLTATAVYSDNTHQDVTTQSSWTSTNSAIATVVTGKAQGVAVGSTHITAAFSGQSATTTLTVTSATLVSVAVTPAVPSVAAGTQQSFKATGTFSDASTQDVTADMSWSSSSTQVATAGPGGQVTSVTPGTALITATCAQSNVCGTSSGTTTLTVTAATLVSIEVTPPSSSVAKGTSEYLEATGIYTDGSAQDLTDQVTWNSSDSGVATVSNSPGSNGVAGSAGVASSAGVGSATITAVAGGISSNAATLTVTDASLVSIQVTPPAPSVANGISQQFVATGVYTDHSTQDLTRQVTWRSSNTSVATVSNASSFNGLANSAGVGSTTITAAAGSISSNEATLTVTAATLVSIQVEPALGSVAKGVSVQFTATGIYTDGSTLNLTAQATWDSSNTSVASVSNALGSNGKASSAGVGSTVITAARNGISSNTATLSVTAAELATLQVTPANPSVAAGNTQQFAATGTYTDGSTADLTGQVTWSSSNGSAATVSNAASSSGLASSTTSVGTTTIQAALGDVSASTTLTVTAAELATIQVTPDIQSISAGNTQQFVATGTYTDGSAVNITSLVTWNSSAPGVATISNASGSRGLASAASIGSTFITALAGSVVSNPAMLTVTAAELVSIQVSPTNPYVIVGNTQQLTATGLYADASTQDLTATASWSSSNTAAATINSSGLASMLATAGVGSATTISAVVGGVSGQTTLTARAVAYAYVLNQGDGTIGQYAIGSDGALTAVGTATTSTNAVTMALDPSGRYAYVSIFTGSIWQYAIGPDGSFTQKSSTSSGGLSNPGAVAVDPTGKYVYVANVNGVKTVSQYTIGTDGALTSMSPATAPTGTGPVAIALDPVGPYAYVPNFFDNDVSEFTRDATNGYLNPIPNDNTISTQTSPGYAVVDPSGRYVYVLAGNSNAIWQYTIGANGSLTFTSTVGIQSPFSMVIDPSGQYAYVTSISSVAQFTINPDGSLTSMSTPTVSVGGNPNGITLDPSGRYVYVTSFTYSFNGNTGNFDFGNNIITRYSVGSGGALTALSSVAAGTDPTAIVTRASQ